MTIETQSFRHVESRQSHCPPATRDGVFRNANNRVPQALAARRPRRISPVTASLGCSSIRVTWSGQAFPVRGSTEPRRAKARLTTRLVTARQRLLYPIAPHNPPPAKGLLTPPTTLPDAASRRSVHSSATHDVFATAAGSHDCPSKLTPTPSPRHL